MTNEKDNDDNTRSMQLFTGEDALMVSLFVSELITVDDKVQFRYLCQCISSLHCMYLDLKYMSSTQTNANTLAHTEESHNSNYNYTENNNNNVNDDENIESLSVELRALQTTLATKCNHHSAVVQLSAIMSLCKMYIQSLQTANYLGIAVGVDVSSSLSVEIASLTTQIFSPLTNATLNTPVK